MDDKKFDKICSLKQTYVLEGVDKNGNPVTQNIEMIPPAALDIIKEQRKMMEWLWEEYVAMSKQFAQLGKKFLNVDYFDPPNDPELKTLLQAVKNNDLAAYTKIIMENKNV